MNENGPKLPRWPLKILKWLCNPVYLEEIEGDLHEAYAARLQNHPWLLAHLFFMLDVISFFRHSMIRNPFYRSKINHADLFCNHFKIAFRIFSKNALFSLINIFGLAIGISAYLLIIQYVRFEYSYDKHHSRVSDLYRVTLSANWGERGFTTLEGNHPAVAPAMKTEYPEVEKYARMVKREAVMGTFILSYANSDGEIVKSNANQDRVFMAETSVFDLFDLPLRLGNPEDALDDPSSIILSAQVAKRFFGNENPLGKSIMLNNNKSLKVTGVLGDLPLNSHLQFDMLVSFSMLGDWTESTWIWPVFDNYVRLKPGVNPKALETKFPPFADKYLAEVMRQYGFETKFGLQPVKDIHLKSQFDGKSLATGSERTLYLLIIIATFVILIALINFINLSTAKSVERAREVGLRKVVGAHKGLLVKQFLTESLIIIMISILLSIILVNLSMNSFNQLVGVRVLSFNLWTEPGVWFTLLLILLVGGILAGIYPSLILSSFKPAFVLKGKFHQTARRAYLRKILVIAQFSISIMLIAGTFIVYSQYSFMQNQDLGYDVEHSLIVNAPMVVDSTIQSKMAAFKNELLQNPDISAVTITNAIPGKRIITGDLVRKIHEEKAQGVGSYFLNIDHGFLDTYHVKLSAGRNLGLEDQTSYGYQEQDSTRSYKVLINKTAAKNLGFLRVEKALGQKIVFRIRGREITTEIVGIVDDYHQQSLRNAFDPIVFLYPSFYEYQYLTLNINTINAKETIEDIGKRFNEFFPHDPYKYFFLDRYFNRQYQADQRFGKVCLLFSCLAIFIAALGLFGLASYMMLRKTKEISIRKVLGASTLQVSMLLPKEFLEIFLISGLIALPIAYFSGERWLSGYAFRVDIGLWMFVFPMLIVITTATFSVLFQSLKVTFINPVDSLRNE